MSPAATRRPAPGSRGAAPDRAAAVRAALRTLVAERGFHGASMGAIAREAGVATGTAYVHYASKDDLVVAAFVESKERLGDAATAGIDLGAPPEERFRQLWRGIHSYLAGDPDEARFLIQVENSPYGVRAHEAAMAREDDALLAIASAPDIVRLLQPLPLDVLYEIGLAPAVRLVARGIDLGETELDRTAAACWRALTRPGP